LLSSFSEQSLEAAAETVPELRRALLLERIPADWKARLIRLGCVAIDIQHRQLSEEIVAAAHDANCKVLTYTANDPMVVERLVAWGVDAIITDAIDVIRP
jgi:glycerophosphoryl diester phosphodiesterase